jgi:5-methylcytosine-specific restriction endonuclease McrA
MKLQIIQKNEHHYQIQGGQFTVNYYPSKRTYYINGAVRGNRYKDMEQLYKIAKGEYSKSVSIESVKRKSLGGKIDRLLEKYSSICCVCQQRIDDKIEASVEHFVPLSKGGSNRFDNLRISHKGCNFARKDSLKLSCQLRDYNDEFYDRTI